MQVPLIGQFITIGMMHLVGTAFYFMHLSILSHIQQTEKKLEHSFSEINYLKQQLNPHFLLNAINNLYGVALSTPNDVPDKILELSDLLKYQINTIKKDWIALQVEMDFIDKYLNYTKWKSSTINITEEVNGSFQNFLITPLIFLPLIENAVKYSAHTKAPKITMQWTFADNELVFSISNNFSENKSNLQSTKTGITNLERRLELYHPQSKLTLSQNNTNFTAQLKLWKLTTVA
jgi:LytS/YehU family sensor histidine kinase